MTSTPTARAAGTPAPADGRGWFPAAAGRPDASRTPPTSRWNCRRSSKRVRAHPDDPLHIHSDSQYVVHGINNGRYKRWLKQNWHNSKRRPVANRDLWEPLIELWLPRRSEVAFVWIPGHAGNRHNELADKLARRAADTQQPATGTNSATA